METSGLYGPKIFATTATGLILGKSQEWENPWDHDEGSLKD